MRRWQFFFLIIAMTLSALIQLAAAQSVSNQPFDSGKYLIQVDTITGANQYFRSGKGWLGADGAATIDIGQGKVLWLFSDTFIAKDSGKSRLDAVMIHNSIAIQVGHQLLPAGPRFTWGRLETNPHDFFYQPGKNWFWCGSGIMINDKLLIFLMNVKTINTGFGFEVFGWTAVLISNPQEDPALWKMKYIPGGETFGLIAGSAAVLKDDQFVYAYGAVEPATHEVYLLRWPINKAYSGDLANPEWWIKDSWQVRHKKFPIPEPLFIGATEFSVHYDSSIKKYIQVQAYGFGSAQIGIRLSNRLQGKWSEPYMIYTPDYTGFRQPFMYAAKAHPEISGKGTYITYNVNSFDFNEVLANAKLYYPGFIRFSISDK